LKRLHGYKRRIDTVCQVSIPEAICEAIGLSTGNKVELQFDGCGFTIIPYSDGDITRGMVKTLSNRSKIGLPMEDLKSIGINPSYKTNVDVEVSLKGAAIYIEPVFQRCVICRNMTRTIVISNRFVCKLCISSLIDQFLLARQMNGTIWKEA